MNIEKSRDEGIFSSPISRLAFAPYDVQPPKIERGEMLIPLLPSMEAERSMDGWGEHREVFPISLHSLSLSNEDVELSKEMQSTTAASVRALVTDSEGRLKALIKECSIEAKVEGSDEAKNIHIAIGNQTQFRHYLNKTAHKILESILQDPSIKNTLTARWNIKESDLKKVLEDLKEGNIEQVPYSVKFELELINIEIYKQFAQQVWPTLFLNLEIKALKTSKVKLESEYQIHENGLGTKKHKQIQKALSATQFFIQQISSFQKQGFTPNEESLQKADALLQRNYRLEDDLSGAKVIPLHTKALKEATLSALIDQRHDIEDGLLNFSAQNYDKVMDEVRKHSAKQGIEQDDGELKWVLDNLEDLMDIAHPAMLKEFQRLEKKIQEESKQLNDGDEKTFSEGYLQLSLDLQKMQHLENALKEFMSCLDKQVKKEKVPQLFLELAHRDVRAFGSLENRFQKYHLLNDKAVANLNKEAEKYFSQDEVEAFKQLSTSESKERVPFKHIEREAGGFSFMKALTFYLAAAPNPHKAETTETYGKALENVRRMHSSKTMEAAVKKPPDLMSHYEESSSAQSGFAVEEKSMPPMEVLADLTQETFFSSIGSALASIKSSIQDKLAEKSRLAGLKLSLYTNQIEVFKSLLSFGISKDEVNELLAAAAAKGNVEALKALIENGAEIDTKNADDETALMVAARNGQGDAIKLLLENGADPYIKDKYQHNAMVLAIIKGQLSSCKTFLEEGFDPNWKDDQRDWRGDKKDSLLILAVRYHNTGIVDLLINQGANVNDREKGETALTISRQYGFHDISQLLLNAGADEKLAIGEESIIKVLTHSWEIKGTTKIGPFQVRREGWFQGLNARFMSQTVEEFSSQYPQALNINQKNLLQQALDNPDVQHHRSLRWEAPKLLEKIQRGEAVNLFTGWLQKTGGHAVTVTIKGEYLMLSNRGEGTIMPIQIFKIDPSKLTERILRELEWPDPITHRTAFAATMAKLGASKDDICNALESLNPLKKFQEVGNCSWESPETSIFGLLALDNLLAVPKGADKSAYSEAIEKAYGSYNGWLQHAKMTFLELYIKVHKEDSPDTDYTMDFQLFQEILSKELEELPSTSIFQMNLTDIARSLLKKLNPCVYNSALAQTVCEKSGLPSSPPWIKDVEKRMADLRIQHSFAKKLSDYSSYLNILGPALFGIKTLHLHYRNRLGRGHV